MRLRVWKSEDGWRVSLVFRNGRIFATSEAYSSKAKAEDAADKIVWERIEGVTVQKGK